MTYRYRNDCHSTDPCASPPPECSAEFTANGQTGHQQFAPGSNVSLEARDKSAERYRWEIVISPPDCAPSYTNLAPHTILLMLPKPGAYVVELTVTNGACRAQHRVILWAVTPRLMYRIPASSEPLRFDGKREWSGDLDRVILDVDHNLPTDQEKAALKGFNEHHPPGTENPYATREDLIDRPGPPGRQLTDDEIDAIKNAQEPQAGNPFLTQIQLDEYLSDDDKDAIKKAEGHPGCQNPFVTKEQLEAVKNSLDTYLSKDDKDAIEKAEGHPDCQNPFVTKEQLDNYLTENQRDALTETRAHPPTGQNPFLTKEDVSEIAELTNNQKAALTEARDHPPTDQNRFLTAQEVSEITELTDNQKAALTEAREYPPTDQNHFLTAQEVNDLAELTDNQKAALTEAREYPPTDQNHFLTAQEVNDLAELTDNQKAALTEAREHPPTDQNPFLTKEEVNGLAELTDNQKAALTETREHPPTNQNHFVTRDGLDEELIKEPFKGAIEAAKDANQTNRFATLADLHPIEKSGAQIVAAGVVDLSMITPDGVFGGLRVVRNRNGWGMATLSFDGYTLNNQQNYVIKALPIGVPRQKFNEMIAVHFVEFQEDGFILQMSQPFASDGGGRAALGPCMVEVTELMVEGSVRARVIASGVKIADRETGLTAEVPPPSLPNLTDAIEDYYNVFIAAGQYADAWPMLSDRFKAAMVLTTLEEYRQMWEQAGPVSLLGFEEVELTENRATLTIDLDYRQSGPSRQTCYFIKDEQEGHPRFGYWLFEQQDTDPDSELRRYRPAKES